MTITSQTIPSLAAPSVSCRRHRTRPYRLNQSRAQQHGLVLVVVLWMLAMLSIIAGSLVRDGRAEIRMAANQIDRWQAMALAEAGVYRGIALLSAKTRWLTSGEVQTLRLDEDKIRLAIYDEAGRVDLNSADPRLLQGLFASVGVKPAQQGHWLDLLADWKDADSLTRLHGAEDEDYLQQGYRYGAKDAAFESVNELRQVLSMDSVLYQKLWPSLTTHSLQRGVNPAVAPESVLRALPGVDKHTLQNYLQQRKIAWQMAGASPKVPHYPRALLNTESGHVFTLLSEGVTENGARARISAIVRLSPKQQPPYSVLSWQQADWFPEDTKAQ